MDKLSTISTISVMLGHPNSSASLLSSAATAPGVMSSVRCSSTFDFSWRIWPSIHGTLPSRNWDFTRKKKQKHGFKMDLKKHK